MTANSDDYFRNESSHPDHGAWLDEQDASDSRSENAAEFNIETDLQRLEEIAEIRTDYNKVLNDIFFGGK